MPKTGDDDQQRTATTRCCNAEFVEMDGGFWHTCRACGGEVHPDDPPLCPGSFTRRIEPGSETMYGATCAECGRRLRVGVGYIQYGNIAGALQPHDPPASSGRSEP